MPDLADATYKWTCPHCGERFEETDTGMLDVRRLTHECKEVPQEKVILSKR